jgi:acetyl-CoA/propionyl-CoA carboxylase, biotin carboxylase, biotin carboxyl carrier protein
VTVVQAAVGDEVTAGTPLLVVEAMKMEHVISAPHAGTVRELDVAPGSTVAMDQVLAVVDPHEPPDQGPAADEPPSDRDVAATEPSAAEPSAAEPSAAESSASASSPPADPPPAEELSRRAESPGPDGSSAPEKPSAPEEVAS